MKRKLLLAGLLSSLALNSPRLCPGAPLADASTNAIVVELQMLLAKSQDETRALAAERSDKRKDQVVGKVLQLAPIVAAGGNVCCPHCGEPMDLFGSGGGEVVASTLTAELGTDIPLLGRVPFDVRLREGGDSGVPLVLSEPDAPAPPRDLGPRPAWIVASAEAAARRAAEAAPGPLETRRRASGSCRAC